MMIFLNPQHPNWFLRQMCRGAVFVLRLLHPNGIEREYLHEWDPCPCGSTWPDGRPKALWSCHGQRHLNTSIDSKKMFQESQAQARQMHDIFLSNHEKGICDACGLKYGEFDDQNPCLHWLLNPTKRSKEQIREVLDAYRFIQIEYFLRLVANEKALGRNINDIPDENHLDSLICETITWRNIEWSFDCSKNDSIGHSFGKWGQSPHYHFQIRVDKQTVFRYRDHHPKITSEDRYNLAARRGEIPNVLFMEGPITGMRAMTKMMDDPETADQLLKMLKPTNDKSEGQFHPFSHIYIKENTELVKAKFKWALEERERTGKPLALLLKGVQGIDADVIVELGDGVPEKAPRTGRKQV